MFRYFIYSVFTRIGLIHIVLSKGYRTAEDCNNQQRFEIICVFHERACVWGLFACEGTRGKSVPQHAYQPKLHNKRRKQERGQSPSSLAYVVHNNNMKRKSTQSKILRIVLKKEEKSRGKTRSQGNTKKTYDSY